MFNATMSNTTDVFISYSHHDRALAEHLSGILEGYGYSVWWDHALLAGTNFRSQIAEQIIESKVVLVLFSHNSIDSGWVLDEAGRADQANKLLPIRINSVDIPLGFGQLHYCDLMIRQENSKEAMDKVLSAIEHHTRKPRNSDFIAPEISTSFENNEDESSGLRDRFRLGLLPDRSILSIMASMGPLYAFALVVAFVMSSGSQEQSALTEWIRMLHAYTGMLTLGGGIFLTVIFRLSDKAPTHTERAAIADVARKLFVAWRMAAIGQLITGFMLIWLSQHGIFSGWIVQSIIFYVIALYLWWVGFGHALKAARYDSLYQIGEHIEDARAMRNNRLMLAMLLTAWVLVTMIYKQHADFGALLNKL